MSGPIVPFVCRAGSVQSITGPLWITNNNGVVTNPATDASMIIALLSCEAFPATRYAEADFPTAAQTVGILVRPSSVVTFDGTVGDRLFNLPVGFILNEITVEYTKAVQTAAPFFDITLQQGPVFGPYTYAPVLNTRAVDPNGTSVTCGDIKNKRTRTSIPAEASFNYLSALYDPYGFSITNHDNSSGGVNYLGLYGTYFQWSLTITSDTDVGGPGDVVTLTDTVEAKFDQIQELAVYWQEDVLGVPTIMGPELITNVLIHTNSVIKFIIPATVPIKTILVISALGNGVEFSGYAPLQVMNANLVDGSGIYTLYPDWRNDTYYDRASPGDLVNLKIPKPFGKTGFFNAK